MHKRLHSYAYTYWILMANGICQKGLYTLHHFSACSACNSWFHVLFQMTIPVKWSVREESHICHVRAGQGQAEWPASFLRLCSGLWSYGKPKKFCTGDQGQSQNQTDKNQTISRISGARHTGQALTCLGLSICYALFLKDCFTYFTFGEVYPLHPP